MYLNGNGHFVLLRLYRSILNNWQTHVHLPVLFFQAFQFSFQFPKKKTKFYYDYTCFLLQLCAYGIFPPRKTDKRMTVSNVNK